MESNLFVKNNIQKLIRGEYTDFLEPNESHLVISYLNKNHINYNIFKPFDDCTKIVIYTNKMPNIYLLEIICKEKLKHSDILGTLFSHNINPSKYGDIIVDNKYYIIVDLHMKKYLMSNLTSIGKYKIKLEERDINIISDFKYKYDELNIIVSSLRIDNVVSSLTNKSRSQTELMFKDKYILVNYKIVGKKTYLIHENDIISIRHYGKYKYLNTIKKTNGCKYIISVLKYR